MASSSSNPSDDVPQSSSAGGGQMGLATEIEDATLRQLLSEDQGAILDRIDQLRGVGLQLPLPQIIVCGDQSSGKSSVLEAISRLPFLKGNGVCTTFPTELALRRGPAWGPTVQIKPAASRSQAEKDRLSQSLLSGTTADSFESVFTKAKETLRKGTAEDSYCEDILHIEVYNPAWPPLTLVDLPGIIHSESKRQAKGDADKVKSLVGSYMQPEHTIILAVVSAVYDLEIQQVLNMADELDPERKRTLGIITKPDLAQQMGPDRTKRLIRYAKNEEHKLDLGWHVLKNFDPEQRGRGLDERDRQEDEFFSEGDWHELLPEHRGVRSLRTKLSSILMSRTRPALPEILNEIRSRLQSCDNELAKLGNPRSSRFEQQAYLTNISYAFDRLLEKAIRGDYSDRSFFQSGLDPTDPRRLRAAIENLNEDFAEAMYAIGHKQVLAPDSDVEERVPPLFPSKYSNTRYRDLPSPKIIGESSYFEDVARRAAQNRGGELPGIPKARLIGELFREHSEPWEGIATAHIETVWEVARETVRLIINHVAPDETAYAILHHLIEDRLQEKREFLLIKLRELLKPYQRYHPITYHPDFFQEIKKIKQHQVEPSESVSTDLCLNTDAKTADVAVGYMMAYYEIAIRTFIDNVATLAVEQCLLDDLTSIFNPNKVPHMSEEDLRILTAESLNTRERRQKLIDERQKLNDAKRIVSRSSGPNFPVSSSPSPSNPKGKGKAAVSTVLRSRNDTSNSVDRPGPSIVASQSTNRSRTPTERSRLLTPNLAPRSSSANPDSNTRHSSGSIFQTTRERSRSSAIGPAQSLPATTSAAYPTTTGAWSWPSPFSSSNAPTTSVSDSSTFGKPTVKSNVFGSHPSSSTPIGTGGGLFGSNWWGSSAGSVPLYTGTSVGTSTSRLFSGSSGSNVTNTSLGRFGPPTGSFGARSFGSILNTSMATTSEANPNPPSTTNTTGFSTGGSPFGQVTSSNPSNLGLFSQPTSSTPRGFMSEETGSDNEQSSDTPDPNVDVTYRRQGMRQFRTRTKEKDESTVRVSEFEHICTRKRVKNASPEEIRFQYYIDMDAISTDGTFTSEYQDFRATLTGFNLSPKWPWLKPRSVF